MMKANHLLRYRNQALALLCGVAALLVAVVFFRLFWDIALRGAGGLSWHFISGDTADAGRGGGIAPVIVSTLLILGVCLVLSLPLSLGSALYLARQPPAERRWSAWVRRSLDILAAVPSVVFGLFGAVFFCEFLGLGYSIAAGGLTLACMILPFMIRAAEDGLRAVPLDYHLAAGALGFSQYRLLVSIVLPVAMPTLLTALVLGIARALAETAALLFTSGYVLRMPDSLLDSARTLSVHIYDLAMNVSGGETNAYRSALVLIVLLLLINTVTHALSHYLTREVRA